MFSPESNMPKTAFSLGTMSVEALLKLRDDIGTMLSEKGQELKKQLQRLEVGGWGSGRTRGATRSHPRKGIKVAPKYRGPNGETWAGRGATPKWLTALVKDGRKPEEFLIARPGKAAASQKRSSSKRSGRRRK
jgi:DNA-binding protein H-NS